MFQSPSTFTDEEFASLCRTLGLPPAPEGYLDCTFPHADDCDCPLKGATTLREAFAIAPEELRPVLALYLAYGATGMMVIDVVLDDPLS